MNFPSSTKSNGQRKEIEFPSIDFYSAISASLQPTTTKSEISTQPNPNDHFSHRTSRNNHQTEHSHLVDLPISSRKDPSISFQQSNDRFTPPSQFIYLSRYYKKKKQEVNPEQGKQSNSSISILPDKEITFQNSARPKETNYRLGFPKTKSGIQVREQSIKSRLALLDTPEESHFQQDVNKTPQNSSLQSGSDASLSLWKKRQKLAVIAAHLKKQQQIPNEVISDFKQSDQNQQRSNKSCLISTGESLLPTQQSNPVFKRNQHNNSFIKKDEKSLKLSFHHQPNSSQQSELNPHMMVSKSQVNQHDKLLENNQIHQIILEQCKSSQDNQFRKQFPHSNFNQIKNSKTLVNYPPLLKQIDKKIQKQYDDSTKSTAVPNTAIVTPLNELQIAPNRNELSFQQADIFKSVNLKNNEVSKHEINPNHIGIESPSKGNKHLGFSKFGAMTPEFDHHKKRSQVLFKQNKQSPMLIRTNKENQQSIFSNDSEKSIINNIKNDTSREQPPEQEIQLKKSNQLQSIKFNFKDNVGEEHHSNEIKARNRAQSTLLESNTSRKDISFFMDQKQFIARQKDSLQCHLSLIEASNKRMLGRPNVFREFMTPIKSRIIEEEKSNLSLQQRSCFHPQSEFKKKVDNAVSPQKISENHRTKRAETSIGDSVGQEWSQSSIQIWRKLSTSKESHLISSIDEELARVDSLAKKSQTALNEYILIKEDAKNILQFLGIQKKAKESIS